MVIFVCTYINVLNSLCKKVSQSATLENTMGWIPLIPWICHCSSLRITFALCIVLYFTFLLRFVISMASSQLETVVY